MTFRQWIVKVPWLSLNGREVQRVVHTERVAMKRCTRSRRQLVVDLFFASESLASRLLLPVAVTGLISATQKHIYLTILPFQVPLRKHDCRDVKSHLSVNKMAFCECA